MAVAFTLIALSAQLFCGAAARHRYAGLCVAQPSSATWLRVTLPHTLPVRILGHIWQTCILGSPPKVQSFMTRMRRQIKFALTSE